MPLHQVEASHFSLSIRKHTALKQRHQARTDSAAWQDEAPHHPASKRREPSECDQGGRVLPLEAGLEDLRSLVGQ